MTTYIEDKDGNLIETSKATSKPSDRHFRNAWTLSGTVISEDMTTAKTMFKDKIREVRKTFDESKCIMTYIEMNTPPPDPDSKYQGYKRKLNAEKELVKDHNRIFCEIYEMTRDAIMTFKLNFPK